MELDWSRARLARTVGSVTGGLWALLPLVFLANLALPFSTLFRAHPTPLHAGVVVAGITLFVTIYGWAAWHVDPGRLGYQPPAPSASWAWRWVPIIVLTVFSVPFILIEGPVWLCLLIFTAATAGSRFPLLRAARVVAVLTVIAAILALLAHDTATDLVSTTFWTGMAGVLTIIINHFRLTNRALHDAREEIARMAVEAERLRIARDLHDLLGHNLAHMALKSDLAAILASSAPDQATAAMREVGEVARTTLQEVRAAVAGYRRPTLEGELRAAREILSAAGIAFTHEGQPLSVPPAAEAVLAWAVREGVTNVVKHSRARHCTIRTTQDASYAVVDVLDDGRGQSADTASAMAAHQGGSGLPGLAERVAAFGGRYEADSRPEGGFRLAVSLPVAQEAEAAVAETGSPAAGVRLGGIA